MIAPGTAVHGGEDYAFERLSIKVKSQPALGGLRHEIVHGHALQGEIPSLGPDLYYVDISRHSRQRPAQ